MESDKRLESNGNEEVEYKALPGGPSNGTHKETNTNGDQEVPILENVYWKEFGLLVFVWAAFLALQTAKNKTTTCSIAYWILNLMQIHVAVGDTLYQAISLYNGKVVIASKGDRHKLESASANFIQCLWYTSWCGRRAPWSWWWIHIGSSILGTWHSSPGLKCYNNFCHGVLFIDVSRGILPSKMFSSSLWWTTSTKIPPILKFRRALEVATRLSCWSNHSLSICMQVDAHEKVIKARVL